MGNTVGSLVLPNVLHARKRLELIMTDLQRDILVGSVLGDAYITTLGKIRVEQSVHAEAYVQWKYEQLKSLVYPALPRRMVRYHSVRNRDYTSLRFSTRQYFRTWRILFYPNGVKAVPHGLVLSPAALAVWYMDDGCWTGSKAVIATDGFDDESHHTLQDTLHALGIETVVGKNRKMTIRKESHRRFFSLIEPFIIPGMRYKLPNPVTT